MAYAALASLAQTIDQILNHSHHHDSFSVDDIQQIVAIHEYAIFLQAFLENFPEKATKFESGFRQLANKAEDVLEELKFKIICRSDIEQLRSVAEDMASLAVQVTKITSTFRTEQVQFGADDYSTAKTTKSSNSRTAAPSTKDIMVGFDEDLMAIKTRACGGSSSKLQFIPIVGMAGIGKTTLARNAYNDPLVKEYFDIRAWVTVSQNFTAKEIVLTLVDSIIDFIAENICGNEEEKVYKTLKGRRYLIVMDDVWSEDALDIVRHVFPDDCNGSRIILTTRITSVAAYPDASISAHEMIFMDPDQSWNLLRQRVFLDQDCPLKLEEIGKTIARKCKGLPLAIVAIAGILSSVAETPTSWNKIADKVNSTRDHERIDEILSLSYAHLPHHLRPCFLYLGAFIKDIDIRVSKLVKLWVAEGFLKHQNPLKSLEEEAEDYVKDLVERNLVLVTKRKSNGKIKSCSLHDLMRDLCIRKAEEEGFLVHISGIKKRRIKHARRLVIKGKDLSRLSNIGSSSIRTIVMHLGSKFVNSDFLASVRLLRVLDSEYPNDSNLSAQLYELFHLRYLAFDSVLYMNPSLVSVLQNLRTLVINKSNGSRSLGVHVHYLPQGIWTMQQLRHVNFCGRLHDPDGTMASRPLQNLQTLKELSYYSCTVKILEMVPNLNKLEVNCDEYRLGSDDYLNNLVHLHQLEKLHLCSKYTMRLGKDDVNFPMRLKKLSLYGILIPWEDFTVVGSLPNLQVLKLYAKIVGRPTKTWKTNEGPEFVGRRTKTWKTNEGEFLQLEFLLIQSSNLEKWITESGHFPKLKLLMFHSCDYIDEIPGDIGEIPTLELIEVKHHLRKRLGRSAKRIQMEQQDLGNYSLEVRVI